MDVAVKSHLDHFPLVLEKSLNVGEDLPDEFFLLGSSLTQHPLKKPQQSQLN